MSAKDAGNLVGMLFLARDLAHRAHLRTTGLGSLARHEALGEFYDAIIDKADLFCESYQGCYNVLLDVPLMDDEATDMIAVMEKQVKWIKANRLQVCGEQETALLNLLDDILLTYYRTLFKLRNLK